MKGIFIWVAICVGMSTICLGSDAPVRPEVTKVDVQWDVKIPMRDTIKLSASVYMPLATKSTACIVALSPYSVHPTHLRGNYFASNGYPFVLVDSRGRGDSEGAFRPLVEARDGYDIVEWLAQQPWCNGKVAMWGGSYVGYTQWTTVKERPPHLRTLVPTASVHPGVDFPMRGNISYPYVTRWLTMVTGRVSQERIFADNDYWTARYREYIEQGRSFGSLAGIAGDRGRTFTEWVRHPEQGAYWDNYVPNAQQYAAIDVPILTITGSYDDDQPGALTYYRDHMRYGSAAAKASHYLVIGPWDHAGTRIPATAFGGLTFGPASLIDINRLHLDWYDWTLAGGSKPEFLKDRVAYYVMGADRWQFAPTLEAVTTREQTLYLSSPGTADDIFGGGVLQAEPRPSAAFDKYVYDPRDVSRAGAESADPESRVDQLAAYVGTGKQLVYHSTPFPRSAEISGFFRLSAWIAIDQPDTDLVVCVYEITADGRSILLTSDMRRARYRESLRQAKLITTHEPLRYDFNGFTFVSREVAAGSRLRLIIGPADSISQQRNRNSGKAVADETMQDARAVNVTLFHDREHPSALFVPLGQTPPRDS